MFFLTILKSGDDAAEVASLTKPNMSHFLIFGASVVEPAGEFSIASERDVLMSISGGIIDAVGAMTFMYYVCNLEFQKECFNIFFITKCLLSIYFPHNFPGNTDLVQITHLL